MKILHLEDDPRDAEIVRDLLETKERGCTITHVTTREDFLLAIEQQEYDVIISDYNLPGFDGIEALSLARSLKPDTPFVFFSGTIGEERAIEAVRLGAADYVIKDRMQRLPIVVDRVMRESEETHYRRLTEQALAKEQYLQRLLMENVPDHVFFKDEASRFIAVSRSLAERFGCTPAEVKGKTDADFFSAQHAHKARADELNIMRTGQSIVAVEEMETWPDGSISWVSTTKLPLRDATGKTVGTFGISRDISERRKRESELRLFRTLVDRSNDVFEIIDTETARFIDVSDRGCTMLGYTREELLKLRVFDVDPDVTQAKWPEIMQATREQGAFSRESVHRRKDGTQFPVEVNVRWVSLDRDYLVAVVRDITERKKAEAELRLRGSALESAANAIVITDRAGRIEWVNSAFAALTGYSAEEAMGRNPNELVKSGRHDQKFYEHLWTTILAGKVWKSEMLNRRKDGTLYSEFQTITPVRDESGRINHFVAIKEDITARKVAEERIREQAEIIDHAPLAILITDLDHRITYCNHGAVEFYGLPRDELVGRTAEDLLVAESLDAIRRARQETLATGRWSGEAPLITKAGRHRQAEFHMLLIRDAEGHPRARLSIAIDITEKKKLEEQFLRAQRLESLGMLAAGIAHDLNNVLAPVLMGAPLLRSRITAPSDLRMIDTIENSAGRGAALVRQILSFAHGASGEKTIIQTKHLMRDVTRLLEETFPKSISLHEEIPNNLWTIRGNPTQVHQILLNLCVNARDAMPAGGTLRVHAENRQLNAAQAQIHPEAHPGAYLAIEVSDTGTGIAPEVLDRIWEPFFTTKAEGKGTGLGLSTVRGIVANHEGFITVDSLQGKGTTFRIFLPAADANAEVKDQVASGSPFLARGNGELLLFVDDEASIRDLATAILSRSGYRVIAARNGVDAISLYVPRATEISLVITDLGMPGMGGEELATAIGRLNPAAKVIFVTGMDGVGGHALPDGAKMLQKPFSVERLLHAVRDAIDAGPPGPA